MSTQRTNAKVIQRMEVDKDQSAKNTQGRNIVDFVGEVKQELKKVDWTSKEELISYTKIVLSSMFIFGIFVYLADICIQSSLWLLNLFVKFFIG